MRAVWSLRAPVGRPSGWASDRAHLLAWVLSVHLARGHFGRAALHGDARAQSVLAGSLALPFDEVVDLDRSGDLPPDDPAPPRLAAVRAQTTPFVHLDADVFLLQPLPKALTHAPIFAQNPIYAARAPAGGATVASDASTASSYPEGWPAALRHAPEQPAAIDCSFLGANFVAFAARYAETAARALAGLPDLPAADAATLEGGLLAAFLAGQRGPDGTADEATSIVYLFESAEAAEQGPRAAAFGYTRLGATGRADVELARRLERRVARDYPDAYRRVLRLLAAWRGW